MISSIHIEGFRGFEHFEMHDLAPVNLLVGANNSGKTSLLEALRLLTSRADPQALWDILWRRGERAVEKPRHPEVPKVDVSGLFAGRAFHADAGFALTASNQRPERTLKVEVTELHEELRREFYLSDNGNSELGLRMSGRPQPLTDLIPLDASGALSVEAIHTPRRSKRGQVREHASPVQYITTDAMNADDIFLMWDGIILKPDEDLVLSALACIDPDVERIAAIRTSNSEHDWRPSRSGFIVKHKRFENPVPIGSLGDGIWRLFSLAIAMTQCRGGVLLVDEIDTGLHYSAMSDMWRLIIRTARMFEVQVFATTHNYDCLSSLASNADAFSSGQLAEPTVSVQRVERDNNRAVSYTGEEIEKAIQHFVEIR